MENIKITGENILPRFGHTITLISRTKAILFGGATGDVGRYTITNDTYIFDLILRKWSKLEPTGQVPTPRAAHASTAVEALQLVIYGGAIGGGGLASDDLFLLDLRSGEENSQYVIVPVVGTTPGRRYGHTIVFSKPYLLVFGGNVGNELSNDIWSLNVERSPFFWMKIECAGNMPSPRVYHAANYCPAGQAIGMMVVFGGRAGEGQALNDMWGFRRHRDGKWDWAKAPYRPNHIPPVHRYQHSVVFVGPLLLIIGGRTNQVGETVPLELYDTETSDLYKFTSIQRFRHSSWVLDTYLYVHGGFEHESPNIPTDNILKIDLAKIFQPFPSLLRAFSMTSEGKQPETQTQSNLNQNFGNSNNTTLGQNQITNNQNINDKNQVPGHNLNYQNESNNMSYSKDPSIQSTQQSINKQGTKQSQSYQQQKNVRLSHQAVIALTYGPNEDPNINQRRISIDKLQEESKKLGIDYANPILSPTTQYHETLYTDIIQQFLKSTDGMIPSDVRFSIKKDRIIKLCDEVAHLLESQPTLLKLRSPIKIYGDVHGQYIDLMKIFETSGNPSDLDAGGDIERLDYLFLGNICDKGRHSLEVICLFFALKLKYPDQFHILRGNHEDRGVNRLFGLGEECIRRLNEDINNPNSVFQAINKVFDYLPLAAVIDNKIFCVHSGIGSRLQSLDDIENIERPIQLVYDPQIIEQQYTQQILYDILWSDPVLNENEFGIGPNIERDFFKNGTIVRYGTERLKKFLAQHNLQLVIRSNECIKEGYEKFGQQNLITIFSCTDYCGKYKNAAALILIKKNSEIIPKVMYPSSPGYWFDFSETLSKKDLALLSSTLPQKQYEEEMRRRHPTPMRYNSTQK